MLSSLARRRRNGLREELLHCGGSQSLETLAASGLLCPKQLLCEGSRLAVHASRDPGSGNPGIVVGSCRGVRRGLPVGTQNLTGAERNPQEAHPRDFGLPAEDVEFTPRGEALLLSGWYLPAEVDGPHLVFVHGLNNVRSGDNAVELAAQLVERGYSVLLFDLRGHGSSEDGRLSGGYYERRDVWGAYDYVVERQGAEAGAVGLVGFSVGAATAVLSAAEEPGIGAVVADSPYAVASELLAQETARSTLFPEWLTPVFIPGVTLLADWRYGIDIDALAPEQAVTRLEYPALVVHGNADTRIPVSHGARVAKAGPAGTKLWRVPGAAHVEAFEDSSDKYVERVGEYLDARLK